jgi:hypothetical protein
MLIASMHEWRRDILAGRIEAERAGQVAHNGFSPAIVPGPC